MAKRPAEVSGKELETIKNGDRPIEIDNDDEAGEFEDEYEDEFESEDEILEAGVDGRPDEEREAEERESRSNAVFSVLAHTTGWSMVKLIILACCWNPVYRQEESLEGAC